MGNLNRNCNWPNCECKTEKGDPCKFENPDFYIYKDKLTIIKDNTKIIRDTELFIAGIREELSNARTKFPTTECVFTALAEEFGEVAKALLKHAAGKSDYQDVWEECIQCAAMACRVAVEGDPSIILTGKTKENQ